MRVLELTNTPQQSCVRSPPRAGPRAAERDQVGRAELGHRGRPGLRHGRPRRPLRSGPSGTVPGAQDIFSVRVRDTKYGLQAIFRIALITFRVARIIMAGPE
jgi:hypothetical protein